jgi:hypothetical protein
MGANEPNRRLPDTIAGAAYRPDDEGGEPG